MATCVQLLYFDGCPSWQLARQRVLAAIDALGMQIPVEYVEVTTMEEAARWGFRGSPTLLVDGEDPWSGGGEPVALACRVYSTPGGIEGSPSLADITAALV